MKIRIVLKYLLIISLTFLLFPSVITFAKGQETNNLISSNFQVIKESDKITLKWEPLSEDSTYIIKHNDQVVFKGTETQFESNNLSEGSINEYEFVTINFKNQVTSRSHLKLYTTLLNGEEIGVDTFSTSSNISLDWPDIKNVNQYEIHRNGELIGITEESHFYDNELSSNTEYNYTITGKIPFTLEELTEIKSKIELDFKRYSESIENIESNNSELQQVLKELEENPYNLVEISTPIKTLEVISNKLTLKEIEAEPQVTPLALASKTWVKINTMILNTSAYPGYIPAPVGSDYYGTDDRTAITSQGSTRSSLEATIDWSTLNVGQTKSIGYTHRYQKNSNGTYTFLDRKQASGNNVYLGATKKTSSMIDINFLHKAAHPYISVAPNVEYEFRSEIYRDGTTKIRGYHTLFPSLGIFRSDGSGYNTIYTHNQGTRSPWSLYSHKTIDVVK